jgi:hypothetical protein
MSWRDTPLALLFDNSHALTASPLACSENKAVTIISVRSCSPLDLHALLFMGWGDSCKSHGSSFGAVGAALLDVGELASFGAEGHKLFEMPDWLRSAQSLLRI